MVPSGLWLSVISNFIDQMVTGDTEICKEYFLLLFSREQMWRKKHENRYVLIA